MYVNRIIVKYVMSNGIQDLSQWNKNVILLKFSSLAAMEFVKMPISSAASNNDLIKNGGISNSVEWLYLFSISLDEFSKK